MHEQQSKDEVLILKTYDRGGALQRHPVHFMRHGDGYVVAAFSEPRVKPDWYLNLKGESIVEIEIDGTDRFASATTPVGRQRLAIWPLVEALTRSVTRRTPRNITGVLLTPME